MTVKNTKSEPVATEVRFRIMHEERGEVHFAQERVYLRKGRSKTIQTSYRFEDGDAGRVAVQATDNFDVRTDQSNVLDIAGSGSSTAQASAAAGDGSTSLLLWAIVIVAAFAVAYYAEFDEVLPR